MPADGETGSRPEPFSPRGRLLAAVIGVVLLGFGGYLVVAVPVDHVSDVVGRLAALSGGTAALLFALPVPRGHDRWRVAGVVCLLAPVLIVWVVLGPLGVLAPEWVADPDAGRRWPETPGQAVTTGWFFTGAALALAAAFAAAVLVDRRTGRRR